MNKYVEGRDYEEMPGGGRLGGPVDHQALIAELQAEKAGLERIIMAQEVALTELREGMEAIGAGGVSPLMGDRHTPHWYAVDNSGMATLCVDEHDALESVKEYAELYPKRTPYIVGRIVAAITSQEEA